MSTGAVRLADQGYLWVGVELTDRDGQTIVDGTQLYVEYQVPEVRTKPIPVVLIHGGGGQSLDWIATPDGRPGWRTLLLQRGYAVYVVDRPGHGRSPRTLDEAGGAAPAGLLPSLETLGELFAGRDDPAHTQWPGSGDRGDPALAQLLAAQRQTGFDLARDHLLMRRNGAALLDRIGPAILIASSAGGPSAWQIADARPDLVRAIVALEPVGPGGPFRLPYGLSAAPLDFEPPLQPSESLAPGEAQDGDGSPAPAGLGSRLPHLRSIPVAIVTAERSFANASGSDAATVAFLRQAGVERVDHLRLAELGLTGNGHLMMLERNHEAVLDIILDWLSSRAGDPPTAS